MLLFYYGAVSVVNLVLAAFIFSRNKQSKINRNFSFFVLGITGWVVTLYLYYEISDYQALQWIGRLNFAFTTALAHFVYRFSYYYPVIIKNERQASRIILTVFTILTIFFTIFTGLVSQEEIPKGTERETIFGPLYYLYLIHFVGLILLAIGRLIRKAMHDKDGDYKRQIIIFLVGFLTAVISGVVTNIILPFSFQVYRYQFLAPLFTLIFLFTTTYAILKYRLLEAKLILSRSLAYAIVIFIISALFIIILLVGATYLGKVSIIAEVAGIVIAATCVVLLLDPMKRKISRLSDAIFFKAAINYDEAARRLTDTINEEIELSPLVKKFRLLITELLRIEDAAIFLKAGDDLFIVPEEDNGHDALKKKITKRNYSSLDPLVLEVSASNDVIFIEDYDRIAAETTESKEKERINMLRHELELMNGFAIVPVATVEKMEAFIVLGQKLSGEFYTEKDRQLLKIIGPQMASALQKARLYEEQIEFAGKLKREVKKATTDLREANDRLKELDQAKSEFMSIASHQLRTPLAGIMGYLSMVVEGDYGEVSKEQAPVLSDVLTASKRLTRLVNTFLNATRIEAGRLSIDYIKVPFGDAVEAMYKELKPTADARNVKLSYKKKKLPEVEVDIDKIKDVILNLIDNAIKYSPGGSVAVSAEKDGDSVHLMVKDTGVGIPKEEAKHLFSKFVRGSGIANVEPNGSGLGLFIAKKIVESHGGKIWAESDGEGKGSTFQFTIPIKAPAALKKAQEEKRKQKEKEAEEAEEKRKAEKASAGEGESTK